MYTETTQPTRRHLVLTRAQRKIYNRLCDQYNSTPVVPSFSFLEYIEMKVQKFQIQDYYDVLEFAKQDF